MDEQHKGLALLCDAGGAVLRVLRDDFGVIRHEPPAETPVAALFDGGDASSVAALFEEIRNSMASLDWQLQLCVSETRVPLHVAGGYVQGQILLVGARSRSGMASKFYEELMQINNEQMNALRSALKELSLRDRHRQERQVRDQQIYGELTHLNNELVNLQRELGKKNAEITAQRERYRELSENLERLVDEKVRELEMARAKAIQMDKMASLGQMATGVAHELNQPLTAISFEADYLKLLAAQAAGGPGDEPAPAGAMVTLEAEELRGIGQNLGEDVARCRRIIDHLRAFGRVSEKQHAPTSLNDAIEGCLVLVGARLRHHDVHLDLTLDPELPQILADVHRLEQVFLNLIGNAEHAMDARAAACEAAAEEAGEARAYRKTLEIVTYCETEDVVAEVRDNGTGIPAEVQARIFEPFFTTKPEGEGTGLGLSISYGIVTDFGGEIAFESAPNQGTTFFLRFPTLERVRAASREPDPRACG